jgi:uncharacterized membrane protein
MQSASTTLRNIKTITELEKSALAGRSLSARVGDAIATQAGRMWFILIHIVWFAIWLVHMSARTIFDPFPFSLLTMIVSLESIFLSLFILMSQNRSNIMAEQRNHLDLQINLLSEDENTKMLQMLRALCAHHKLAIGNDPEISAMARKTEVNEVISELKEHLPGEE